MNKADKYNVKQNSKSFNNVYDIIPIKVQKQEKTSTLLKARDNFYKSQNIRNPQAGGRMIW